MFLQKKKKDKSSTIDKSSTKTSKADSSSSSDDEDEAMLRESGHYRFFDLFEHFPRFILMTFSCYHFFKWVVTKKNCAYGCCKIIKFASIQSFQTFLIFVFQFSMLS